MLTELRSENSMLLLVWELCSAGRFVTLFYVMWRLNGLISINVSVNFYDLPRGENESGA